MKKRYTVNFARHLADCEFNYRRMCLLMPGWGHYPVSESSTNERDEWRYLTGNHLYGANTVVLHVTETAKYTTTVHISVDSQLQKQLSWFKTKKGITPNKTHKKPLRARKSSVYDLEVRLYHDASLAEVITFDNERRFLPRNEYPNHKMFQQDEKSQLNLFLGEILDDCLRQGRVEDAVAFGTQ